MRHKSLARHIISNAVNPELTFFNFFKQCHTLNNHSRYSRIWFYTMCPTGNIGAWDHYSRGMHCIVSDHTGTRKSWFIATKKFRNLALKVSRIIRTAFLIDWIVSKSVPRQRASKGQNEHWVLNCRKCWLRVEQNAKIIDTHN
jgi:hypothetical protein